MREIVVAMFVSARLKIDRANQHLQDLESTIRNPVNLNEASVEPDPQGEFPDYLTQGETLAELEDNLRKLHRDLTNGETPGIRRVSELTLG